jgi:hypothetical protein
MSRLHRPAGRIPSAVSPMQMHPPVSQGFCTSNSAVLRSRGRKAAEFRTARNSALVGRCVARAPVMRIHTRRCMRHPRFDHRPRENALRLPRANLIDRTPNEKPLAFAHHFADSRKRRAATSIDNRAGSRNRTCSRRQLPLRQLGRCSLYASPQRYPSKRQKKRI